MTTIAAIDLGAESGRVIVATFADGKVELDLINRFTHMPLTADGGLRWDIAALQRHIIDGLTQARIRHGDIAAIGVDTWGVDYALIDAAGELVEAPYCYRDKRTDGIMAEARRTMPDAEIFRRTGIRSMQINTLYQLIAHQRQRPASLTTAQRLLGMPDWLHFWLSGERANEQTFSSTTQLCAVGAKEWDRELIRRFAIPDHLFADIAPAGTVLGTLRPALARECGFTVAPRVVLPGSHDTASAVAAVPGDPATTCFISSGTWSLMGAHGSGALTSPEAHAALISNEIGVGGAPRPLTNIMGLWIVQECRRAWAKAGHEKSYAELTRLAMDATPLRAVLDVDDPRFLHSSVDSDDMPSRIRQWCAERTQPAPADVGQTVRFVLDGLADAYARVCANFERLSGKRFAAVHVVGGGGENQFLAQLTADACARPVITGPTEATALGNVLTQAVAIGVLPSPAEARATLARSIALKRYEPSRGAAQHG